MTVFEKLTEDKKESIQDAQDKVKVEVLNNLEYGEEIELNEYFTLYRYTEDDIVVINYTDTWDEVLQVMWGDNDESIIFEEL